MLSFGTAAYAQGSTIGPGSRLEGLTRSNTMSVLGLNVATSAIGAGVTARLAGHSFWRGVLIGAGGGAVGYAGKRLAVQQFDGAGLLGRQVAAVGASIAQNGVSGRGPFDRVVLPLWIGRVYLDRNAPRYAQPRLDLLAGILTTVAVLDVNARFDFGRTLSNGAPVFVQQSIRPEWRGAQLAGVIWLEDRFGEPALRGTLAHEMIHVLQHDGGFISWTELPEQHVMQRLPGFRALTPWVDVGVHSGVRALLNSAVRYERRPWEWEAQRLTDTGPDAHR